MSRRTLLALLVWIGIGCASGPALALVPFLSDAGQFGILLPGKPMESVEKIDDATDPNLKQRQYVFGTLTGAYLISVQDNPDLANATPDAAQKALVRARSGVQKTFSPGKLLSETRILLDEKHPGLEFTIEVLKPPGLYRSRIYLIDGRLYQIVAIGEKPFATSDEADQVLTSFRILKQDASSNTGPN